MRARCNQYVQKCWKCSYEVHSLVRCPECGFDVVSPEQSGVLRRRARIEAIARPVIATAIVLYCVYLVLIACHLMPLQYLTTSQLISRLNTALAKPGTISCAYDVSAELNQRIVTRSIASSTISRLATLCVDSLNDDSVENDALVVDLLMILYVMEYDPAMEIVDHYVQISDSGNERDRLQSFVEWHAWWSTDGVVDRARMFYDEVDRTIAEEKRKSERVVAPIDLDASDFTTSTTR